MKRRPYGRDLGLSIRMAIALVPILLWYLLVGAHGWRRFELFSDHPPPRKRLARLAELSRELGEAA